ncbi:MAG: hypothetical protein IPL08_07885 [Saprospiraceae bacterium]|nr:hypothetical protein [Saprospiraceae bacterium]
MKSLLIFLFIFLGYIINMTGQEAYSTDEKIAFVKILVASKSSLPNVLPDSLLMDAFQKSGLSQEHFSQILVKGLDGQDVGVTVKEQELIKYFRQSQLVLNQKKTEQINAFCIKYEMSIAKYNEILNHFRKDIALQQELVPYFEKESEEK